LLLFVSRDAALSMLRVSPNQRILSSTSHNYHFFTGNVIKAKQEVGHFVVVVGQS